MGFAVVMEAATGTEMADQAVIQRKAATGPATPQYKRPGEGPWKHRDLKRPRGHVREQCLETQRAPLDTSKRADRPPTMRGATGERNNKPQVEEKFYVLDGLPLDAEADVVEGTIQIFSQPAAVFSPKLRIIAPDLHSGAIVPRRIWPNRYLRQTSHHALLLDDRLVESKEGLETKVGLRGDLVGVLGSVAWFYMNGECEATLMYLDSLSLPSCVGTPHNTCN
ncbi:hypothetical protein M9H77_27771 [Catharanthus roseus]|uniref:Uncharacterized protein n=1 Tax=Catharanthus roseus TaxID=4058 RepID=A0ACC0ADG6_CATRO|nr:hypothetical protein M9H77_27771 [Catharanthus roseus]